MKQPFRLDGATELIATFDELTRPAQRNALMRTLRTEIKPLASAVKARAPYDWGDLEENLFIGTRLTKRQASMNRAAGVTKAFAELHFGTADPAGMMNEFGLGNNPPKPFFRPEWEGRKRGILVAIGTRMGNEIVAAGVRAARRRARGR